MPKNTGKPSENAFKSIFAKYGKDAFVYRVTDTAEVRGMSGAGFTKAQPSDYIITLRGEMFYAEAKSTTDPVSFALSNITTGQSVAAKMQIAAGGQYIFFLHCIPTDTWYRVPAQFILAHPAKSVKWSLLTDFIWNPNP